MTRPGRGQATRLALLLVAAGCVEKDLVGGKAPERVTRDMPTARDGVKATRTELYKGRQSEAGAGDLKVEETDPAEARIGAADTRVFHRAACPLLTDVPVAQQVRFTSRWDGLDGGYKPCEECKAGR